jgi:hypothetical protein
MAGCFFFVVLLVVVCVFVVFQKKVIAKGTPSTQRTTTSTKGAISKMRFVSHPSSLLLESPLLPAMPFFLLRTAKNLQRRLQAQAPFPVVRIPLNSLTLFAKPGS